MLKSKTMCRQRTLLVRSSVIISKVKCLWKARVLSTPPLGGFPSMLHAALCYDPRPPESSDVARTGRHRRLALAMRATSLPTDTLSSHWLFPIPLFSGTPPRKLHLWIAKTLDYYGSLGPDGLLGRLMGPLATIHAWATRR